MGLMWTDLYREYQSFIKEVGFITYTQWLENMVLYERETVQHRNRYINQLLPENIKYREVLRRIANLDDIDLDEDEWAEDPTGRGDMLLELAQDLAKEALE